MKSTVGFTNETLMRRQASFPLTQGCRVNVPSPSLLFGSSMQTTPFRWPCHFQRKINKFSRLLVCISVSRQCILFPIAGNSSLLLHHVIRGPQQGIRYIRYNTGKEVNLFLEITTRRNMKPLMLDAITDLYLMDFSGFYF